MKKDKIIKDKKNFYIRIISVLIAIVCVGGIIIGSLMNIRRELEEQIQQSLEDVTRQNTYALKKEIDVKKKLLKGLALGFPDTQEGIESNLVQLHTMKDLYRFKRVGFINMDGETFMSDGYRANLAGWKYFEGTCNYKTAFVSGSIKDTISEDDFINVITMPVFEKDQKTMRGVIFASYQTKIFRESLSIESFQGRGASCVLLPDGEIMSGTSRFEMKEAENFFTLMSEYGEKNDVAIEKMKLDFLNGKSGMVVYHGDTKYYMHYMPVEVIEKETVWYLATVVPVDILEHRTEAISRDAGVLVFLLSFIIIICIVICIGTYWYQHKQVLRMAYIDSLTGEENYTAFRAKMRERKRAGYIVSVNLSEFKVINNICGIQKGDELLCRMWDILKEMMKSDEFGGHISGDRFVLFLKEDKLDIIVERIVKCKEKLSALSVELNTPRIVPCFGIYATTDSRHSEDGYGKANLAIKNIGNYWENCYAVYNEDFRQHLLRDKWMKDNFETALENKQFEVWYQPKYSPKTNTLVGAEALVRWRDSQGKLIPPNEFISFFEKNGMIVRLDEYVFRQVCMDQKMWAEKGETLFPVSVNVSRTSLYYQGIVDKYLSIIKEAGIDISLVELEVTESAMMDNKEIEKLLRHFYDVGFKILIDDFGSGYSSLSMLNIDCIETIKLDKILVDYIGDQNGETLLHSIISLAHTLGLSVTAEGVEEHEQVLFLKEWKCDDIQGYYYSRPLCKRDFEAFCLQDKSIWV